MRPSSRKVSAPRRRAPVETTGAPLEARGRMKPITNPRPHHHRSHRRRHGLDRRGDGRDADPRLAFDQHQGAARLLDGAVQRRRRDALPGRAHPDPSRQLPRPHQAHHAALPDPGHPAGRRLHRQRRLRGRRHAPARHRAGRADLHRRPPGRLDGEPGAPCRLRRSRPCPHLPGGAAHPAGAPLPRRRAAGRRAGPDPAELPGAGRAPVRPARADGRQSRRRKTLPGAGGEVRHRDGAGAPARR